MRVIKSWRAGVGKTLYKRKLVEKLCNLYPDVARTKKTVVSISLYEREINIDDIMSVFLKNTLHPGKIEPRLFHIDLSHEVRLHLLIDRMKLLVFIKFTLFRDKALIPSLLYHIVKKWILCQCFGDFNKSSCKMIYCTIYIDARSKHILVLSKIFKVGLNMLVPYRIFTFWTKQWDE